MTELMPIPVVIGVLIVTALLPTAVSPAGADMQFAVGPILDDASDETTSVYEEVSGARVVGGLWHLQGLPEDLEIKLWGDVSTGDSVNQWILRFVDLDGGEVGYVEFIMYRWGEIGVWYRSGDDQVDQNVYEAETLSYGWSDELPAEWGNDTIMMLLISSTKPTRMGFEIANLPSSATRIDQGHVALSWDDMDREGLTVTAVSSVGTKSGSLGFTTTACSYGVLGVAEFWKVAASEYTFDLPEDGIVADTWLGHRFDVFDAPPHQWALDIQWTGFGHLPQPFVALFEGPCLDEVAARAGR